MFLKQILQTYYILRKEDINHELETDKDFAKCLLKGKATWKKYKSDMDNNVDDDEGNPPM